jgi:hypothetical protein
MLDECTEDIIEDIERGEYKTLAQLIESVGRDQQDFEILVERFKFKKPSMLFDRIKKVEKEINNDMELIRCLQNSTSPVFFEDIAEDGEIKVFRIF